MSTLNAAAGNRRTASTGAESEYFATFCRYLQSTEKHAASLAELVGEMMTPKYRTKNGFEPYWRTALLRVAQTLVREASDGISATVPAGYESLISLYDQYAGACGQLADSLLDFLDGLDDTSVPAAATLPTGGIQTALRILRAENQARLIHLRRLGFEMNS